MQQKRPPELLGINNTRGYFDMRVFNGLVIEQEYWYPGTSVSGIYEIEPSLHQLITTTLSKAFQASYMTKQAFRIGSSIVKNLLLCYYKDIYSSWSQRIKIPIL